MSAIMIDQLPKKVINRVRILQYAKRPVYVLGSNGDCGVCVIPNLEVGTQEYGESEIKLIEAGWKLVLG